MILAKLLDPNRTFWASLWKSLGSEMFDTHQWHLMLTFYKISAPELLVLKNRDYITGIQSVIIGGA